jgi:hypothetical protein
MDTSRRRLRPRLRQNHPATRGARLSQGRNVTDIDGSPISSSQGLQAGDAVLRFAVEDPGAHLLVAVIGERSDQGNTDSGARRTAAAPADRFLSSTQLCAQARATFRCAG